MSIRLKKLTAAWGVVLLALVCLSLGLQAQVECTADPNNAVFVWGGVPKDGIPALTHPALRRASEATYLANDDLVLGLVMNGQARAYPHRLLWWHEIVNDTLGGRAITVSYCPLTGTGILFDAIIDGVVHTFGVSGLLYNNNLVMYDRNTDNTLFPQMCGRAFAGRLRGTRLTLLPVIETTWEMWQRLHPNSTVLSNQTGYDRDYDVNPYAGYATDEAIYFPLQPDDPRLPRKAMVLGLAIKGVARAYPFRDMGAVAVLNDTVGGVPVLIVYDQSSRLSIPFYRQVGNQVLTFGLDNGSAGIPFNLRDRETNTVWNVKGEALSGSLAESHMKLEQVPAYTAYWFAWAAFWIGSDIADIRAIAGADSTKTGGASPTRFRLGQNYPNPFNPPTTIGYEVATAGRVVLEVYTLLGQKVRTLVNEFKNPGRYAVTWDGIDHRGQRMPSGVYFYKLRAGQFEETKRMVLAK